MGVTRRFDELRPIRIEDAAEFNYADFDLSESGDETERTRATSENCAAGDAGGTPSSRSRKNKERRAERKMRRFLDETETDGVHVKSNMGARKWKRVENARTLLTLTDKDDICTDFTDMLPQSVSSFEQLFIERESMAAWNEFIEKDEAEQRVILENGKWTSDEQRGWFVVGGKCTSRKAQRERDGRKHHPAYSAKACFERLDRRAKKLMSERHLPWAFLDRIEDELRAFFESDSAGAVFVGRYESSMERALAHSVSQYLMLASKSITERGTGVRITEIRNPRAYFVPPRSNLIPYLSSLRAQPIEFVPWVDEEEKKEEEERKEEKDDLNISGSSNSSFCEVDMSSLSL